MGVNRKSKYLTDRVRMLILAKWSIKDICNHLSVDIRKVYAVIDKMKPYKTNQILQKVAEPYYEDEEEMELGYVVPEYKDLSKDEKEIWNELEKEKVAC